MESQTVNKRKEKDVMRLMLSKHVVEMTQDNTSDFHVLFPGPLNSLYQGVSPALIGVLALFERTWVGNLESACVYPGTVSVQVAFDRVQQQDLPPKHRRKANYKSQFAVNPLVGLAPSASTSLIKRGRRCMT